MDFENIFIVEKICRTMFSIFLLSLTISKKVFFGGSDFRNGDFDGFTRFEVP